MIHTIIRVLFQVLTFVILADVLLSYFMSPFHPIRKALDAIVNPLLMPIRKIVPAVSGIDFSPIILLVLLQVIEYILLQVI